jgi:anti-sigma regulatory factor (Ser/Thr protein kinase)
MSEPLVLDAGSAVAALPGEVVCGDVAVVRRFERERLLVLLSDGLGHGPEAADAANRCVNALASTYEKGIAEAFAEAHRALRGGRGAVAAALSIDGHARTADVSIVGNVVVRHVSMREGKPRSTVAVSVPGVLGQAFRSTRLERFDIEAGDVLIVHSDGVPLHFDTLAVRATEAESAAREIVLCHRKERDDASCVVVRVLPPGTIVSTTGREPSSDAGQRIPLSSAADIQVAATAARQFAASIGMPGRTQWEVGIAAAELAQNAVKYGIEGALILRSEDRTLVLEVVDRGEGFGATKDQPGLRSGLAAVNRMMDSIEVYSGPIGTRVVAKKRYEG